MHERVKSVIYPLCAFVVLVLAWDAAIRLLKVPNFILPAPADVLTALKKGYIDGLFWQHFFFTSQSMLAGYVMGCSAAFALGCLFAESRAVERTLLPFVVALQSMPKVALAPLIIVWFGFGIESKIVMVALVCFFPMFINTVVGLKQTSPALLDLMAAFSASRWNVLLRIKIPSAAGHIFAGLQIAIVLGLIGAVVAEFVSSTKGLGHLINAAAVNLETNVMFAALISLAALGVGGSQLMRFLHAKIVFWDKGSSTEQVATE